MQVLAIRHDANVYGKGERDLYAGSTRFKKKYPASLLCIISMKVKKSESVSCSVKSNALRPHGLEPARLLCPWNSPGKSTGVGCHSLLQGVFLTQASNLGLSCIAGRFSTI